MKSLSLAKQLILPISSTLIFIHGCGKLEPKIIDPNGVLNRNNGSTSLTAPTSLALGGTTITPSLDSTPTITVSGVSNGDTVKIFTDSTCTVLKGTATATGTTVDITLSSPLSVATYNLYSNREDSQGIISNCSTSNIAFNFLGCPSNYILIPGNATIGIATPDFCVMKYEAKAWDDQSGNSDGVVDISEVDYSGCGDGGGCATNNWSSITTHKPASTSTGSPWRQISADSAWIECDSLNSEFGSRALVDSDNNKDGTYTLISNPQWMTIARNIENTPSNWSGGTVGAGGHISRGWSAKTADDVFQNTTVAPSTDSNCLFNTGADTCASTGLHKLKRTQVISNNLSNNEIWDFAGNTWEWVDWDNTGSPDFTKGPSDGGFAGRELSVLAGSIQPTDLQPFENSYTSLENFGR